MDTKDLHEFAERFRQSRPVAERRVTKRDIIEHIKPDILKLRTEGYSWDSIAAHLGSLDVVIAATTLKNYLKQPRRSPNKRRRARLRPAEGTS